MGIVNILRPGIPFVVTHLRLYKMVYTCNIVLAHTCICTFYCMILLFLKLLLLLLLHVPCNNDDGGKMNGLN